MYLYTYYICVIYIYTHTYVVLWLLYVAIHVTFMCIRCIRVGSLPAYYHLWFFNMEDWLMIVIIQISTNKHVTLIGWWFFCYFTIIKTMIIITVNHYIYNCIINI